MYNIRNLIAFLDMIASAEGTINLGWNGYNVLVGGALFRGYTDHPRIAVDLGRGLRSTAAGRYQILARYYDAYRTRLSLPDFSPDSQDKIAIQMIKECKALDDIDLGRFDVAVKKCRSRWASLPGAGYGQREVDLNTLRAIYLRRGGIYQA